MMRPNGKTFFKTRLRIYNLPFTALMKWLSFADIISLVVNHKPKNQAIIDLTILTIFWDLFGIFLGSFWDLFGAFSERVTCRVDTLFMPTRSDTSVYMNTQSSYPNLARTEYLIFLLNTAGLRFFGHH